MIRPSAVSGTFYHADPQKLKSYIKKALSSVKIPKTILSSIKDPLGYIVPHAGYVYSGLTAAYAYKIIEKNPVSTLIILGPSHHIFVKGSCVYPEGNFETPLGNVKVNEKVCSFLLKHKDFSVNEEAQLVEHSIEVQLPFLQMVLQKDFKIVPIIIGSNNLIHFEKLVESFLEIFDRFKDETFAVIASTDLSRFHPLEVSKRIDSNFINLVRSLNFKEIIEGINSNQIEACGAGPVLTTLLLCNTMNKKNVTVLHHSNSSLHSHNKKRVVGYFSAVIS